MSRTYRSTVFACLYVGVALLVAVGWVMLAGLATWSSVALVAFGLLAFPFVWAKVQVNDEGIIQQTLRRHTVRWTDILSWQRVAHPDSDGPDTITVRTRAGSLTLNHNCVYGKRLDFVESELRRRVAQLGASPKGGPAKLPGNSGVAGGPPSVT